MQNRKIKIIWDFRGPAASKTAEHHEIHLKEYIEIEALDLNITGCKHVNDMHSYAYMIINEVQIPVLRDALKPHRAEVYEPQ